MTIKTKWVEKENCQYFICSFSKCNDFVISVTSDGYHATSDIIMSTNGLIYCTKHANIIRRLLKNGSDKKMTTDKIICCVCKKQSEDHFNNCNNCGGSVCDEHNNMCELCNYTICSNDMTTNPFHDNWCKICEKEYYNGSD